MSLNLTYHPIDLTLKTPFTIAATSSDVRTNIIVRIEEGWGEAPVVPYYQDTPQTILNSLAGQTKAALGLGSDPFLLDDILSNLPALPSTARSAIDIALHDLIGKRLGAPLYKILGLNPRRIPETSFTIAIDDPKLMARRARDSKLPILKIKVGKENDLEIVRAVREATSARLRLDANGGWSREQAANLIPQLAEFDIELIEQPIPKNDIEGFKWLKTRIKVPLYADESVQTERDLLALAGSIDGVVIKLMKAGGIRAALRQITLARALGMRIMLSCMVESSLGVTAAAHIAPLCDEVDLDGPLLITNDPFVGITYVGAQIELPAGPGLGVRN